MAHDPAERKEILEEVRRIEMRTRRLVDGALAGEFASVFRGAGLEFEELREYVAGDDPRAVDWNVTARAGRPFVKQFVDERHLTVLFVFDASASMDAGGAAWTPRAAAARLCACLGLSAARQQDRVGLATCGGDGSVRFLPPRTGRAQVLRVVARVLSERPPGRGSDLSAGLRLAVRARTGPALVFPLSDFRTEGWERALRGCARRHDVVAVRLADAAPPWEQARRAAWSRVEDAEDGTREVLDLRAPRVRAAWRRREAAWRTRTEEAVRRAGADLVDVALPAQPRLEALVRPLQSLFQSRGRRRARR